MSGTYYGPMRFVSAMLAEPTPDTRLPDLIADDNIAAEWKVDGYRCLMHIEERRIAPISRSGEILNVKPHILDKFKPFLDTDTRWVFDGEYLDGVYYIFDIVEAGTLIKPTMPYGQRRTALEHFWDGWSPSGSNVILLPSYREAAEKAALVERVKFLGGEGVMFKRLDASYAPGKRSPHNMKVKFRNDIDCVVLVLGIDGKSNMSLGLFKDGDIVPVGECGTLTGDGPKIRVGDVVTVNYQYASKKHRLVQPTLPRLRFDKKPEECTFDQLVYVNKTVETTL